MTLRLTVTVVALAVTTASVPARTQIPASPGVVRSEFVFESAPFASAHASTIAETRDGLVVAWFGGTREGADDVGIWLSRQTKGGWTPPVEVASGVQADGTRYPCWNPVLFATNGKATLLLYYKVGPNPREWWGMVRASTDDGRTWSEAPARLPGGFLGPIKNKPVALPGVAVIMPSSTESDLATNEWRVHFERTSGNGATKVVPAEPVGARPIDAIQPTILRYADGRLQALVRTRSGRIGETWSRDDGVTWSAITLTSLPNPNAGIDAVTLRDGRQLIVYNHTADGRTPLNVAVSMDGHAWSAALVLEREPGEYSYPAVIQSGDGLVHVTYTWKRLRITHVVIDPARLTVTPIVDGRWPGAR